MHLSSKKLRKLSEEELLNLWDEYIIYAIILNENKKIKRKVLKMWNEYFEDEGREIEC